MSAAILKLPTCSQLSPMTADSKSLSVDRSQHDVLLNDIVLLSQRAAGILPPVQPTPVLTPADRSVTASDRYETLLEGETISCFIVGGEKRMCFPQIISQVLKDVSLPDVNKAFSDLNIHCSVSTKEQLDTLKVTGVMPMTADSCGLITKTDAERLVHCLLYDRKPNRRRPMLNSDEPRKRAFPVVHDCFGGCQGSFLPDLYTSAPSECIECSECQEVFAPDRFVVHTHSDGERERTCHWGFDSANWRAYIHLPEPVCQDETVVDKLDVLKHKFHPKALIGNSLKRSVEKAGFDLEALEKRTRVDATNPLNVYDSLYYQAMLLQSGLLKFNFLNGASAFQQPRAPTPAAAKTFDAAAGLLALSHGLVGRSAIIKPQAQKLTTEPLKKHLLHQFEEQQRQLAASPERELDCRESQTERPDSESTTSASESEDEPSLDALLAKHISEPDILRLIREKIADSQRGLEIKIDSLCTQNHILQQEIACLRNKRSTDVSPVSSTPHAPSLKLAC